MAAGNLKKDVTNMENLPSKFLCGFIYNISINISIVLHVSHQDQCCVHHGIISFVLYLCVNVDCIQNIPSTSKKMKNL